MICKVFNKMGKFIGYIFGTGWDYQNKVELW